VPNGPADTATFDSSNTTNVSLSANTKVNGIVFNPGASAFTITVAPTFDLTISGLGITNNAATIQNFVVAAGAGNVSGSLFFTNGATAGNNNTHFTLNGSPGADGFIVFSGDSTADNATFTINGADSIPEGARVIFHNRSTAGNATLVANDGTNGGGGGLIIFMGSSTGGTARVEVFGKGELIIGGNVHRPPQTPSVTIGSIEGTGNVFLGVRNLTVGSNNLSTLFSGDIRDRELGGSLTKIGTGKLVLSHRNTYTGGTTVKRGRLIVNNIGDSGTGSGPVEANGGRLGGMGTIAGAVTVGSGRGREAVLSPGYHHSTNPGTLIIQSLLTFNSDATYEIEVNSSRETVDKVVALGVTINVGAQTLFADLGNGTFAVGSVFTVIDNTSATPIAGTFSNLPDGAVFTVNGNTYQASYEGGDGNDLTLTVVT
jgi:autotransporter-associated beta strand protein